MVAHKRASHAPCPLCGHTTDDYYHRLVECTEPGVEEARQILPHKWLQAVTKAGRSNIDGKLLCFTSVPKHVRTEFWVARYEMKDTEGNLLDGQFAF